MREPYSCVKTNFSKIEARIDYVFFFQFFAYFSHLLGFYVRSGATRTLCGYHILWDTLRQTYNFVTVTSPWEFCDKHNFVAVAFSSYTL